MLALKTLLKFVGRLLLAVLLGGLLGGALARYSAGFGVDERELDSRLSQSTQEHIRAEKSEGNHFLVFYRSFLVNLAKGEMGYSNTLNQPIAELLRERVPRSLQEMFMGLTAGAAFAGIFAAAAQFSGNPALQASTQLLSNLALCLPVAILGYSSVLFRWNPCWALSVCTFPHLFNYAANLLRHSASTPYTLAARCRGIPDYRIHSIYVFLPCVPDLLATLGMSVSVAFGALIPIEFATETPGLGQLAWQAASSRDLPLLCVLTMITTVLVLGANCLGDLAQLAFPRQGRNLP